MLCGQIWGRQTGGAGGLDGGGCSWRRGGTLGIVCGEEAEWLALVGGQGGAIALEVARDAAAGGTRAVTEGLDAALPLQLCSRSYNVPGGGLRHCVGQSLPEAFVGGIC